jgi:hypothetical protein
LLFGNPNEKLPSRKLNGAHPKRNRWLLLENVSQLLMSASVGLMRWPLNQSIGPMFIRLGPLKLEGLFIE